jgi:hypothetical protein
VSLVGRTQTTPQRLVAGLSVKTAKTLVGNSSATNSGVFRFQALTPKRWRDLEHLFGARGACGGCWCMMWRLARVDFEKQKGSANQAALRRIIDSKKPAGVIAYYQGQPAGWCAIAPRNDYPALGALEFLSLLTTNWCGPLPAFSSPANFDAVGFLHNSCTRPRNMRKAAAPG